jgi:hypothetical protein
MENTITVTIDGVEQEVVTVDNYNSLNERFTAQQSELTQWQQGVKRLDDKPSDGAPPPPPKQPEDKPNENPLSLGDKPTNGGAKNEVDLDAIKDEYIKTGALTDEAKEKLTGAGYDPTAVEYNFKTDITKAAAELSQIYDSVGGEEAFNALREWAVSNLDDAQKGAYEAILATGNVHAIMSHLQTLSMQKQEAEGTPPNKQLGGDGKAVLPNDTSGYTTQQEVAAARKDPRYKTDAEYTKLVDTKLFNTPASVLGWRS